MEIDKLRKAGQVHKEIVAELEKSLCGETKLYDIANHIEKSIENAGFEVAFPTGVSVNECAAHWTPNPNSKDMSVVLKDSDIIKIDFGVHKDGNIIDGAFSWTNNPELVPLINVAKEANQRAIKLAGVDAILGEIGQEIQEIITNSEVTINNEVYPLKSIQNLCGHNIDKYMIHSGKAVPNIKIEYPMRMEENEVFAIEPFPTTGSGIAANPQKIECSHFMFDYTIPKKQMKKNIYKCNEQEKQLYQNIKSNFGKLCFCPRFMKNKNIEYAHKTLKALVQKQIIQEYEPLYDVKGSRVSQFEKTIYIHPHKVEILN